MATITTFQEYNSSSSSFDVATNLNFGSTKSANLNTQLYPILANSYSYEKWIKVKFDGIFTTVSDVKFYKSAGSYVTGEQINFTGEETTWATPINTVSTVATTSLPISEPASANVSIGGNLAGTLATGETTDFIVIQSSIDANASAGAVNEKTFTLYWLEN